LNETDRSTVLKWADRVFEDERCQTFFAAGSLVECEPEWMGQKGLMRPDRVVRNEEGWHVVDYKTGEVNLDVHANQVRKYMRTLAALESTQPRGWILYLNPLRLVEVFPEETPRIFGAD
jgi:ATP-dependent exoDNAse (exonuclease V) beta subunit